MSQTLQATIERRREMLTGLLFRSLLRLARRCASVIPDRERLERNRSDLLSSNFLAPWGEGKKAAGAERLRPMRRRR